MCGAARHVSIDRAFKHDDKLPPRRRGPVIIIVSAGFLENDTAGLKGSGKHADRAFAFKW
jgi:hypothetical protein